MSHDWNRPFCGKCQNQNCKCLFFAPNSFLSAINSSFLKKYIISFIFHFVTLDPRVWVSDFPSPSNSINLIMLMYGYFFDGPNISTILKNFSSIDNNSQPREVTVMKFLRYNNNYWPGNLLEVSVLTLFNSHSSIFQLTFSYNKKFEQAPRPLINFFRLFYRGA